MAKEIGVWGIDLGQCALKAIRLQEVNGELTATAFDYVEHPKILSQPDADPDALTREALEKFLSRNTLRGDMVAISVPGQSGLARFVKLPPVEEKKISDIVRFEAKQQIPFNLDEVVWDYQKIGSGIVTDGFAMETEIGLFAMKRDMIGKYLQHFKDVKVEVHIVQMAPLALCNFVAYDLLNKGAQGEKAEGEDEGSAKTKNCVVALDIGADSSNLIITDGERIIWQRPIPLGGNHFTRALTKDLKLTFAKAEHLKRNASKSPDIKKILASLKPVLNDFVGEVQRSLGYFTNTHRDAHVEYMVGLGNAFRLPGLQRFLAEKLQLDVRKLAKLERLGGEVLNAPTYTENILSFAVSYGLAVQGLKHARLVTNLLPGEIRVERMVRAKKPWAVTAAASLMITSAAMAWDLNAAVQSYGAQVVLDAEQKAAAVNKAVADADAAFAKAKSAAEDEVRAVRAIVAGQAEQRNWLKITKFFGELIPQPDGVNFPPQFKNKYWDAVERTHAAKGGVPGKRAYEEYKRRVEGLAPGVSESGKITDIDDLGRGIDDLILFNIESIDCRFCENLTDFWAVAKKTMDDPDRTKVKPAGDWDAAPAGNGWVFEMRGYTYHYKKTQFITDALVENIARVGGPEQSATAAPAADPKADPKAQPGAKPGTPAPPAAPAAGGKPAAGGAAPAAAGAGKNDLESLEAACKAPFQHCISHVMLYKTFSAPVTGYGLNEATLLAPVLDNVVGAKPGADVGAGGPAAPGGGFQMKPTGVGGGPGIIAGPAGGSSGWTSLLGTSGEGNAGNRNSGGIPQGPIGRPRRSRSGPGGDIGAPSPGDIAAPTPAFRQDATAVAPIVEEGRHVRTDFVILFVWKEPTPSDILRQIGGKK